MNTSPFQNTPEGLRAENQSIRLLLSPIHSRFLIDGGVLVEETECNLLLRHVKEESDFQLSINGKPATKPIYLQDGSTVWGRLNTGDRPGHIRFQVTQNRTVIFCAELPIRPAKLDYETDYQSMRNDLENICRTLTFAPPQHAHTSARTQAEPNTPFEFLQIASKHLARLRTVLTDICKNPNRKLATHTQHSPVSRAKGHDPDAIAYLLRTPSVWTLLPQDAPLIPLPTASKQIGYTTLRETHRQPDTQTPANRHLVFHLHRLCARANAMARTLPETSPYYALCTQIRTHLGRVLRIPPLRDVLPANPGDPFPPHLDPRYTTALHLCRDLFHALLPCVGGPFDLSFRDTPTLYEYWTWLSLLQTFLDLGFTIDPDALKWYFKISLNRLTFRIPQGEAAAIPLRKNRFHLSITYNPTYTTTQGRTLTHDLRPDVVVDIQHPGGEHKIHVFDAKYRREAAPSGTWLPLAEDIDKMHAYRDAIGQVTPDTFTRLLQSAIVLYPAPVDTRYHTHPFYKSLSHGVGALPLLPGDPQTQKAFQAYIQNNILKNGPPDQSSL